GDARGATVRVGAGEGVRVRARVTSQYPLDRIEVIHNGTVVAEAKARGDRLSADIEHVVNVERSGWVAVRASGPPHRDQPGGAVFGHTSAVYVEVPGRRVD